MLTKDFKTEFDVKLDKWEFEGYAAVKNNVDNDDERIKDGAFTKTLQERYTKGKIKVFWRHVEPMGLPRYMEEDSTGLFTTSKVSKTRTNEERLILLRDKVVDEMSIGYKIIKDSIVVEDGREIRDLLELKLYEYSPVPFGANELTAITGVKELDLATLFRLLSRYEQGQKGATGFADLPLAARERAWDGDKAVARVRTWAGGPDKDEIDWAKYAKAFFWFDSDDRENYSAYKLPFADIIGGKLTAIPRGIFAGAAAIMGARGGVDIPSTDEGKVKAHMEKYYGKMKKQFEDDSIVAPWKKELKEGRILSASNRQKIADAVRVLQDLLDATDDSGKDIELETTVKDLLNEMQTLRKIYS